MSTFLHLCSLHWEACFNSIHTNERHALLNTGYLVRHSRLSQVALCQWRTPAALGEFQRRSSCSGFWEVSSTKMLSDVFYKGIIFHRTQHPNPDWTWAPSSLWAAPALMQNLKNLISNEDGQRLCSFPIRIAPCRSTNLCPACLNWTGLWLLRTSPGLTKLQASVKGTFKRICVNHMQCCLNGKPTSNKQYVVCSFVPVLEDFQLNKISWKDRLHASALSERHCRS